MRPNAAARTEAADEGECGVDRLKFDGVLDVVRNPRLNHRPQVAGGLLARECGEVLSSFFASRR